MASYDPTPRPEPAMDEKVRTHLPTLDSTSTSSTPSMTQKPPDQASAAEFEVAEALTPAQPIRSDPADFPDGGLQAWLVVAGGCCCTFTSFGWINCIGVFQDYYQHNQLSAYSPSVIAWIGATETFVMFVGAPLSGKIFDSYGTRFLLLFGTAMHILGLMMTSLATQYYQFFLAQAVCSGIGASALYYAGTNPVGTWFLKKRALAYGIVASGSSLSGVLMPIVITRLIPTVGFGWAMRVCAFVFLALLIVANVTVKSRLRPKPTRVHVMDFVGPLREKPFFWVAVGSFLFFWGVYPPQAFLILEAKNYGMSPYLASYLLTILNAASIFGRILPGWLGDRLGRFNVMIVTAALTTFFILALWIPGKSNGAIIAFAAIFGFTSGTFVGMIPALVAQISDVSKIGTRNGANFFIISIAALTGNPIAGALVSRDGGGYIILQVFCGVTMALSTVAFIVSRTVQVGFKAKKI